MAKERHVRKYAQLYTNLGIDVLKVRVSPFDLLRPTKGSQVSDVISTVIKGIVVGVVICYCCLMRLLVLLGFIMFLFKI